MSIFGQGSALASPNLGIPQASHSLDDPSAHASTHLSLDAWEAQLLPFQDQLVGVALCAIVLAEAVGLAAS